MKDAGKLSKPMNILIVIVAIAILGYVIAGPIYGAMIKSESTTIDSIGSATPAAEGGGGDPQPTSCSLSSYCMGYDIANCQKSGTGCGKYGPTEDCQYGGYECCCKDTTSTSTTTTSTSTTSTSTTSTSTSTTTTILDCDAACTSDADCVNCNNGNTCSSGTCITVQDCSETCENGGVGRPEGCWIPGGKPVPGAPTCEDYNGVWVTDPICSTGFGWGPGHCCCLETCTSAADCDTGEICLNGACRLEEASYSGAAGLMKSLGGSDPGTCAASGYTITSDDCNEDFCFFAVMGDDGESCICVLDDSNCDPPQFAAPANQFGCSDGYFFNGGTFPYSTAGAATVKLTATTMQPRVYTIFERGVPAGVHEYYWAAADAGWATGNYIFRMYVNGGQIGPNCEIMMIK